MAQTMRTLDSLGSFCDEERTIEAICWTHRGDGWAIHDWQAGEAFHVGTRREAVAKVRAILRERARGMYDAAPTDEELVRLFGEPRAVCDGCGADLLRNDPHQNDCAV